MENRQPDDETPPELDNLYRFTALTLALGVPPARVAGDYFNGLETLRREGAITLDEMARERAKLAEAEGSAQGSTPGFTDGYKAGYLSAWAAAVFRVLDTRGVETTKEFDRGLSMLRDANALTLCLERAVTASHVRDLFAGSPHPGEAPA